MGIQSVSVSELCTCKGLSTPHTFQFDENLMGDSVEQPLTVSEALEIVLQPLSSTLKLDLSAYHVMDFSLNASR